MIGLPTLAANGKLAVRNEPTFENSGAADLANVSSDDSGNAAGHEDSITSGQGDIGPTAEASPPLVPIVCFTKTAVDAIANGDNWDVTFKLVLTNCGTVALESVEVFDDIARACGGQFAGVRLESVTSGVDNSGAELIFGSGFAANTSLSLVKSTGRVEVGDTFEVVFVITIDPHVDGTAVDGLESQASAICEVIDENGRQIANLVRSSATSYADEKDDALTTGTDCRAMVKSVANEEADVVIAEAVDAKSVADKPVPLNSGNFEELLEVEEVLSVSYEEVPTAADPRDKIESSKTPSKVPTAIPSDKEAHEISTSPDVPNLEIAKSIVGDPVLTDRGNYVLTCQLIIENTGNVDLENLSLLEDLSSHFGRPMVKAGNLTVTSIPSVEGSRVFVDSVGWNGKISIELLDNSEFNVLVAGDSFTIQFEVEINPSRMTLPAENQPLDSQEVRNVRHGQESQTGFSSFESINSLIDDFNSAMGPIYSGTPVNRDLNPLPQIKEPAGAAGVFVGEGSIFAGV